MLHQVDLEAVSDDTSVEVEFHPNFYCAIEKKLLDGACCKVTVRTQGNGPQVSSYSWFDMFLRQRKENASVICQ